MLKYFWRSVASMPLISVIMSVRNAGERIQKTLESVTSQNGVDIEFIVVDDGSDDNTGEILWHIAKEDKRVKVLKREKRGITDSLIEACNQAQGEYIARQDANDISLVGRLCTQLQALTDNQEASMCSTQVRFVTKEGDIVMQTSEACETPYDFTGIIHGSVMMRTNKYHQVGGYRSEFYYAQDVDLWSRLVEVGKHLYVPSVYYEGMLFAGSISGSKRMEQERFFHYIKKATSCRRRGQSERKWLEKARDFSKACRLAKVSQRKGGDGAYFIGSCLEANNPKLACLYLEEALQANPTHIRAWLRLAKLKCF